MSSVAEASSQPWDLEGNIAVEYPHKTSAAVNRSKPFFFNLASRCRPFKKKKDSAFGVVTSAKVASAIYCRRCRPSLLGQLLGLV